jgi:hypothetical protein
MTKRNRNFLLGSLLFLLSSSYGALNLLVRKLQEGQMYRAQKEIARALKRNESIDYLEYSLDNLKNTRGKIVT